MTDETLDWLAGLLASWLEAPRRKWALDSDLIHAGERFLASRDRVEGRVRIGSAEWAARREVAQAALVVAETRGLIIADDKARGFFALSMSLEPPEDAVVYRVRMSTDREQR